MEGNKQEKIDAYVRNEMSVSERNDFVQELLSDAALREELEMAQDIVSGISDRALKKRQIREWNQRRSNTPSLLAYGSVGIAAAIAIGFFFFRNEQESMYDGSVSVPNEVVGTYYSYAELSALIQDKDYAKALQRIESIERSDAAMVATHADTMDISSNRYELMWFKAQALVGLERSVDAIQILEKLKTVEGKFQNQIDSLCRSIQKQ